MAAVARRLAVGCIKLYSVGSRDLTYATGGPLRVSF